MTKLSTRMALRIAMSIPDDSPKPALSLPRNGRRNDYPVRLRASLSCKLNTRDVVTFAVRQGQSMTT